MRTLIVSDLHLGSGLGSDVLSRFGAIRIDFSAQTLTLGGPQGPVLVNRAERVRALSGPPPPAVLTQGQAGTTVPLAAGCMCCGFASLGFVLLAEKGRLFRAHHSSSELTDMRNTPVEAASMH